MLENIDVLPTGTGQLFDAVRKIGHNREIYIESGIVVSEPPDLKIEVDGDVILEADDLIVAEHLTNHKRNMTLRKSVDPRFVSYIRHHSDDVQESMSVEGLLAHTHNIFSLTMDNVQDDFIIEKVEVEYNDELRLGDRVLIISDDETDEYYVIDRVVEYVAAE